jgi:hypothetical protein
MNEFCALAFADTIKNGNTPKGLQIDISDNNLGDEGIKKLAEAMLYNTSIIMLNIKNSSGRSENVVSKIIDVCCVRNQLLLKYPEYETFIKEVSYKNNLYIPGIHGFHVQPLKSIVSAKILKLCLLFRICGSLEARVAYQVDDIKQFLCNYTRENHKLFS